MTIDPKIRSGLALNQNILLANYYKYGVSPLPPLHDYSYDYMSGAYTKPSYGGLTRKQVIRARASLLSRGYIAHKPCGEYYVTEKGLTAIQNHDFIRSGPKGPHSGKSQKTIKGSLINYLWSALRTKNSATIKELLALVPLEEENYDQTYENARRLLHWLCKAHIIRQLPRKKKGMALTSPGYTRYQLMIDLGPRHPVIRVRKHQIYDPNSQTNVAFKDVLETFKGNLNRR